MVEQVANYIKVSSQKIRISSLSQKQFEKLLKLWKYSKQPRPAVEEQALRNFDMDDIDLDCVPTAIDLGRARAFHNAARIHAKIVYSR